MKVHTYKNTTWKFRYSEKATKFEKISQYIWHYFKLGDFFQNFVAFSEYLKFRNIFTPLWIAACWNIVMHIWNLTMCFSHEALQQCWPTMHSRTYVIQGGPWVISICNIIQFESETFLRLMTRHGIIRFIKVAKTQSFNSFSTCTGKKELVNCS